MVVLMGAIPHAIHSASGAAALYFSLLLLEDRSNILTVDCTTAVEGIYIHSVDMLVYTKETQLMMCDFYFTGLVRQIPEIQLYRSSLVYHIFLILDSRYVVSGWIR